MTIFSGHSVISRVSRHVLVMVRLDGTSTEVVQKKYQVPGTVPSGKPPKSEPYRAVPCSGKAPFMHCKSLWIKASGKCISVTINLFFIPQLPVDFRDGVKNETGFSLMPSKYLLI